MLLIITPRANVFGSIRMNISSLTVGLVIDPVTLIDISISVIQFALPMRHTFPPLALITVTIYPGLDTRAIAQTTITYLARPLPSVLSSTVQSNHFFSDSINCMLFLYIYDILLGRFRIIVNLCQRLLSHQRWLLICGDSFFCKNCLFLLSLLRIILILTIRTVLSSFIS